MSNSFCRSIKTIQVKRPFSNPVVILTVRCPKQVFAEKFFSKIQLKPVQKFVLTQKFLYLVMNNPFNNF